MSSNCRNNDNLFPHDSIKMLRNYDNVELVLVDKANHSLELDDDLDGCLKILNQATKLCAQFIKED